MAYAARTDFHNLYYLCTIEDLIALDHVTAEIYRMRSGDSGNSDDITESIPHG